jgi:cysteine desulfurase
VTGGTAHDPPADPTGDRPGSGYLDAATAAPLHPVARTALLAALDDGWGDPDRLYAGARRSRQLLDAATAATAEALGVREDEVTFCASGTDAAHRAVAGALHAARRATGPPPTLVHSAIEHASVLDAVGPAGGVSVPVDRLGRVDLDAFAAAVRGPGVGLAALISASHEVGTCQPVTAAAGHCAAAGVPLYVDAAQSVGHVPVPPGWSVLTASARKWGGPAGVGVLVVRRGTRFEPLGPPPGPVSVPAVVAAAASLRAVLADAAAEAGRLSALVARIRATVAATVPLVEVVGDPDDRLPHLVTFSCLYVDGEALLHALDRRGFAVSSGSACTARTRHPSHVLAAMGVLTHGNVRVSLHRETTEADVDRFLAALPDTVTTLRAEAGVNDL